MSIVKSRPTQSGLFGALLISLVLDAGSVLRLIHGPISPAFFLPWILAGFVALLLSIPAFSRYGGLHHSAKVVLGFAIVLVTLFSDGTNLSLWVALALYFGPPSPVWSRRLAAMGCALAHGVAQFTLLPLPPAHAPWAYAIIQAPGLLGFLLWKAWRHGPTPTALS